MSKDTALIGQQHKGDSENVQKQKRPCHLDQRKWNGSRHKFSYAAKREEEGEGEGE